MRARGWSSRQCRFGSYFAHPYEYNIAEKEESCSIPMRCTIMERSFVVSHGERLLADAGGEGNVQCALLLCCLFQIHFSLMHLAYIPFILSLIVY